MQINEIQGRVTLEDGSVVEFSLTRSAYEDAIGWAQWGQPERVLWHTAPALSALATFINEDEGADGS